jgi:hypothetical protein
VRKLIEATLVSLDGIVESPWEWAGRYFDEESKRRPVVVAGVAVPDRDQCLPDRAQGPQPPIAAIRRRRTQHDPPPRPPPQGGRVPVTASAAGP